MRFFTFILVCVVAAFAAGQPATPEQMAGVKPNKDYGTAHLQSNLGSFKLRDGQGKVTMTFTGTLMVSKLDGKLEVTGNLRKEYEDKGRVVYHGTGKAIITGSFRGIQWFGRDMRCTWYGFGLIQISGEFDKNLDTGYFWFDVPEHKRPWFVGGVTTIPLSADQMENRVAPIERGKTKTGGG